MFHQLMTQNLILRPFTINDVRRIYQLSQEDGLKQWIPDQVYKDENEAKDVIEYLMSQYQSPDPHKSPLVVAVVQKSTDEVIGHVGLSPKDDLVEIGYAIEEGYFGRGYATEAVKVMSDWAKKTLGLKTILGIVASENGASGKVLEKAGFKLFDEKEMFYLGKKRRCREYRLS